MWECPKCDKTIEDAFVVCWHCGTLPDGTEDPDFQVEGEPSDPIDTSSEPLASVPPVNPYRFSAFGLLVGAILGPAGMGFPPLKTFIPGGTILWILSATTFVAAASQLPLTQWMKRWTPETDSNLSGPEWLKELFYPSFPDIERSLGKLFFFFCGFCLGGLLLFPWIGNWLLRYVLLTASALAGLWVGFKIPTTQEK